MLCVQTQSSSRKPCTRVRKRTPRGGDLVFSALPSRLRSVNPPYRKRWRHIYPCTILPLLFTVLDIPYGVLRSEIISFKNCKLVGATNKQLQLAIRAGLEPGISGFQVQLPNHKAMLSLCTSVLLCFIISPYHHDLTFFPRRIFLENFNRHFFPFQGALSTCWTFSAMVQTQLSVRDQLSYFLR